MDNELKSMYFVNGQNRDFRPFKMYFDGDGALIMELCWAVNEQPRRIFPPWAMKSTEALIWL